jgi:hypothetical protein
VEKGISALLTWLGVNKSRKIKELSNSLTNPFGSQLCEMPLVNVKQLITLDDITSWRALDSTYIQNLHIGHSDSHLVQQRIVLDDSITQPLIYRIEGSLLGNQQWNGALEMSPRPHNQYFFPRERR